MYIILFINHSFFLYNHFALTAFDLGIFDQSVWLISHGHLPFDTVRGLNIFADHFSPILYLIAPLYWIWDDPKALLVFQSIVLGMGALPVYLIAKNEIKSQWIAVLFSVCYLLYPALEWTNTFDYHPETLGTLFILLSYYFIKKNNTRWYFISLTIFALTKETAGIVIISIGIYLFIIRKYKSGCITISFGLIITTVALSIMKYYNNGIPSPYYFLYSQYGGSPLLIFRYIMFHPFRILHDLLTSDNIVFIFQLFSPVLFISFLAPEILLITIPNILECLLSSRVQMHDIMFHYTVFITPFVFISAIVAFRRIKDWSNNIAACFLALELLVAASIYFTTGPLMSSKHLVQPFDNIQVADANSVIKLIPPYASVSAQREFVPHIAHRLRIYTFPNPFYSFCWGGTIIALKEEAGLYSPPCNSVELDSAIMFSKVDYILLIPKNSEFSTGDNNKYFCIVYNILKNPLYGIVRITPNIILLKRNSNHKLGLQSLIKSAGMKRINELNIKISLYRMMTK